VTIMFRVILKCLVSLTLIGIILRVVPLSTIVDSLQEASLPIVGATLCLTTSMVIVAGFYAATLARIQGQAISPLRFAHISFTTLFYGIFLPGAISGGLIRWQKLNQVRNDKARNATVIAMGRLITLLMAGIVGLACWSLDVKAGVREGALLVAAVAALSILYVLVMHFPLSGKLTQKLENRLNKWPRLRAALLGVLASFSELYRTPVRQLVPLLATSVAYHVCGVLAYYLFSVALGLDVSPLALGWIRSYVLMAALLPISFAGIGVREGLLTLLLPAYGVSPHEAVALGLLLLLSRLVNALIGAVLEADHVLRKRIASATTPR
jgi:uncharacterized protein (TIRG00374 family)